jgi:hypothetical protein
MMTHALKTILSAAFLVVAAQAASAECYADYKAKRDNPLKLHYGVMQVSGSCTKQEAAAQLAGRLQSNGWTLLNVLSVFDASGLAERKNSAGQFYLRF